VTIVRFFSLPMVTQTFASVNLQVFRDDALDGRALGFIVGQPARARAVRHALEFKGI
jgi:hypothetical protein